jgi:hypothetical protein
MSLSLQLLHREDFESRTLRALLGGAAAGVLGALALRLRVPVDPGYLAVVGAALLGARPSPGARWGLRLALAAMPLVPHLFDGPTVVAQGLSGAAAAALVAWRGLERETPGEPVAVASSAAAAGLLVPLGVYVAAVLEARLFGGAANALSTVLGFTAVALFWSVGTLPAHVQVHLDPVEARGDTLETTLGGEVRELAARALGLYRQCKALAAKLAPSPGRTELTGTLEKMAREAFSLAETHAGLEAQLGAVVQGDVDQQVKDLKARAAATGDSVARRQLELAASSLGEELNHLEALGRRKERLLAQLHAQVALLERARVSLVGAQGGELGDKGAQAAQLARRLAALGQEGVPPAPAPVDAGSTAPAQPSGRVTG